MSILEFSGFFEKDLFWIQTYILHIECEKIILLINDLQVLNHTEMSRKEITLKMNNWQKSILSVKLNE